MKKTVLITGASRGIGRAAALKFAREGRYLIINALHDSPQLKSLEAELDELGCGYTAVVGDIGNPDFVHSFIAEAFTVTGHIDVLVNNAGISHVGLLQDMSDDDWNRIVATNLSGMHYCCHDVITGMLKAGSGHIINISSVWGNVGASCEVAYSATKGGINSYTKALAKELAPSGISVNAIACGCVDTDMNRCFTDDERAALYEEIPAGRFADPDEIAELIYTISESSSYLTGQIITMDGAWT